MHIIALCNLNIRNLETNLFYRYLFNFLNFFINKELNSWHYVKELVFKPE